MPFTAVGYRNLNSNFTIQKGIHNDCTKPKVQKVSCLTRVSVYGVKSLGGHFACLCRGFEIYEVKKNILLFFEKKREILLHLYALSFYGSEMILDCPNHFDPVPFHFGRVQFVLVRPKSFWTGQNYKN